MIDEQRLQEIEAMAILAGDRAIIHVEGDLAGIRALQMVLGQDIPDLVAALREARELLREAQELIAELMAPRSIKLPSGSIANAPGYILDNPRYVKVLEQMDEAFREQIKTHKAQEPDPQQ